jgi:non-specific protein-tyrosine kinase
MKTEQLWIGERTDAVYTNSIPTHLNGTGDPGGGRVNAETHKYFGYIARWSWLILLIAVIAGGAGYILAANQEPLYIAEAKVFIGNAINNPDPDLAAINVSQRLAPTYAEFAKTHEILAATIENEGFDLTPEELEGMVNTRVILDTTILVIEVTNPNPQLAADLANGIARNLVLNSPSNLTPEEQQQMELQGEQIQELRDQIATMNEQSVEILGQLNDATEAGDNPEIFRLTDRYNRLVEQMNVTRATLAQLSETLLGLSNRVNRLEIIEAARPPSAPAGVRPIAIGILGLVAGAGVATAGVLLYFEYVDDKLRTESEVRRIMGLPILGTVARDNKVSRNQTRLLKSGDITRTAISESYRTVQAKLLEWLDQSERQKQNSIFYLIASPGSGEGRTFTVANLAVVLAASGLRVLVVDSDTRNPRLHQIFQLDNEHGIATLAEPTNGKSSFQKTGIPNLDVLPSGTGKAQPGTNHRGPTRLLESIRHIRQEGTYDVVLFDIPPSLAAADSYILAAAMRCKVILVVEANQTGATQALKVKDQFAQIGTDIKGIIINKS